MSARLARIERPALIAGGSALALTALGGIFNPSQFFHSYLFAFLFCLGLGLGCLSVLMIHHLTGGLWGLVIRRVLEAGTRTIPLAALLFVPLALGLGWLYPWVHPPAGDAVLREAVEHKHLYLNRGFFLLRAALYFAAWWALAYWMNRWSLASDEEPDPRLLSRMAGVAGPGLILMGLTITFASIDWAMSLDPRWFSTIYGILFMVGQALSALCLVVLVIAWIGDEPPLAQVVRPQTVHDLGKLMLAFVMLWAYVNFSQFLIIWSANLPEEIPWYLRRLRTGWRFVGLFLVLFHFAVPFLLLLSRPLKRDARWLARVAAALLAARLIDLFWLIGPEASPGGGVHWMDAVAPVGLIGLWLAYFLRQLRNRPLLPLGDPEIRALLEAA
ncbi:MAG TPA: hypothetical protein VGQ78_01790 [Vicinamibacteria bacterium]|nr:hypothetical protein [Vicinamibacteria bacterium]